MTEEDLEQELRLATSVTDVTASVDSLKLRDGTDPLMDHPPKSIQENPNDLDEQDPLIELDGGNGDENQGFHSTKDAHRKLNDGSNDVGNRDEPIIPQIRPDDVD